MEVRAKRKAVIPMSLFLAGVALGVGGTWSLQHLRHFRPALTPRQMNPFHKVEEDLISRMKKQEETLNSIMKRSLFQVDDSENNFVWNPLMDVEEVAVDDSGKEIIYRVPIENIEGKNVNVDVQGGVVTVTAKSEMSKKGENSLDEELTSQYQKTFPLVAGANPAKMDFRIEKDLIIIRFPRLKGA